MKEVSTKIFNRLCRQGISVERCKCGYSPEVVAVFSQCGMTGVRVECGCCRAKTEFHDIAMCIVDEKSKRVGVPVTQRSMMRGIMAAIEDWNRRMKEVNYNAICDFM